MGERTAYWSHTRFRPRTYVRGNYCTAHAPGCRFWNVDDPSRPPAGATIVDCRNCQNRGQLTFLVPDALQALSDEDLAALQAAVDRLGARLVTTIQPPWDREEASDG